LIFDFENARRTLKFQANIAKWMTLPFQSGNMSQLYRGFSWNSVLAKVAGATGVASMYS